MARRRLDRAVRSPPSDGKLVRGTVRWFITEPTLEGRTDVDGRATEPKLVKESDD